ncbi:unnamed protein product [Cylicostephanus goldi]|uniref:Uncharacterized protein n=1 Tax=Cylicostephanus goldi TaxID=71465 RepID=A0A3P7N147_CYLGO|nr:unnamed protein product [Cylicostephanus goldi]
MFLYALTFLVIFNVIIQDTVQAVLPSTSDDDPSAPACTPNTRNIAPDHVCQMMKDKHQCQMVGAKITCQKTCVCDAQKN